MVTCVGKPTFDFRTLQELIPESQRRTIAESGIKFNNISGLLVLLASFQYKKPIDAIHNCGSLLAHIQYSFLVMPQLSGLADFGIKVTNLPDDEMLVSGTIKQFRDGALECCQGGHALQGLFSEIILFLMNDGLAEIFKDITKITTPNGLILKRK